MRRLLWVLPLLSLMGADCGSAGTCSLSKGAEPGVTVLTCSDGSKATVAPEPAGTNCPFGGQKLEISSGGMTNATFACNGAPGANGAPGDAAKVTVTSEPAGANCEAGGKRVDSQVGNGAITTSYVCNGEGVVAVAEAAGSNCAAGGVKVTSSSGATFYVCNGTNGSNGSNGSNGTNGTDGADGADGVSVTVTNEAAGNNCPAGGVKITDGVTTQYVCNGQNGASGQGAAVTSETPGNNCPTGGVKIVADGATQYVCNGANGQNVLVTSEPPGPHCPNGGVKISNGVSAPQYACNGSGDGAGGSGNPLGINAGPDQVVSELTQVTLSGTAGPTVLGVQWQQVLGPPVQIINPSGLTAFFNAPSYSSPAERTLVFELRGSDGQILASDLVVIHLNKPPGFKPIIGVSPNGPLNNDHITCHVAWQDPDPDGDALVHAFHWKKNGQPFYAVQNFRYVSVVPASGTAVGDTFECEVTVTDGNAVLVSDTFSQTVGVLSGNCSGATPYAVYQAGNTTCCGANQHLGGFSSSNVPLCADLGQCTTGYQNGGAGLCEYAPTCSGGFHDGGNGTCVPDGSCAPGYHDGGDTSTTVTNIIDNVTCVQLGSCSPGYQDGGNGTCVPAGSCVPGFHDGGSGACVPANACSAGFKLQQDGTCGPACPNGQHDGGNGACLSTELCSPGFHDDGMGACLSNQASPYCASGYKNDGSGACVNTAQCAAGFKSSGGACVPHTACPMGQHDDGTDTCVSDGAFPACAQGFHLLGAGCVPDFFKVVTGGHHACAVTSATGVYCWGRGLEGQLGTGKTKGSTLPVPVKGLQSGVISLALGEFHSCALISDGTVRCWGKNDVGQLGDGTTDGRLLPVKVQLSAGVKVPQLRELTLTAGQEHTCALTSSQGVSCWGGNTKGALGGGPSSPSPTPTTVGSLPLASSLVELVSGAHHNCVRTNSKAVGCWGDNAEAQLGNGNFFNTSMPSQVTSSDSSFSPIGLFSGHSAHHTYSASLALSGLSFHGWGDDDAGQIGTGSFTSFRATPALLGVLGNGAANGISAGAEHGCGITAGGALECWGGNTKGQLGYAPFSSGMPAPGSAAATQPVTGLSSGVVSVSASAAFTCAVTDGGQRVRCWGTGPEGELGNGFTVPQGEPVVVQGL